jgi:L-fuconate dehydratase
VLYSSHLELCAGRDPNSAELTGKNAGPTGAVFMIDANQVWDVQQAIDWVSSLKELRPWFIEEPTAPDDILGHAAIRKGLKPHGIGVATGEHAHNRMVFKQLLQAEAIDVCQIDSCRLAGVSEVISVLLMAAKYAPYRSAVACAHI